VVRVRLGRFGLGLVLWAACPGALPPRQLTDSRPPAVDQKPVVPDQTVWQMTDSSSTDRAADSGKPGDARQDQPGGGQTCPTTASCTLPCAAGHCNHNCGNATVCVSQCNLGGCSTKCGGAKTCVVQCSAGKCKVTCGTSACVVYCNGGGCEVDCTGAAACTVVCPANTCTVKK
jgi:hypothetical protein